VSLHIGGSGGIRESSSRIATNQQVIENFLQLGRAFRASAASSLGSTYKQNPVSRGPRGTGTSGTDSSEGDSSGGPSLICQSYSCIIVVPFLYCDCSYLYFSEFCTGQLILNCFTLLRTELVESEWESDDRDRQGGEEHH